MNNRAQKDYKAKNEIVSFISKRYTCWLDVGRYITLWTFMGKGQLWAAGAISESTGCGPRFPSAPERLGECWPHTGALCSKFSFKKFSFMTHLLTSDNCANPLSLYFPLMGNREWRHLPHRSSGGLNELPGSVTCQRTERLFLKETADVEVLF